MKKADDIPHPGKFDDILTEIKRFSDAQHLNDFRMDLSKQITPHLQHSLGFILANKRNQQHTIEGPTSYSMSFQTEKRELFQMNFDSILNYQAQTKIPVISDKNHGEIFNIGIIAQRQKLAIPKDQQLPPGKSDIMNVLVLDTENKFEKSSLSSRLILRDHNTPPSVTLSYLQAITKNLSVGVQTEQTIISPLQSVWAYVVKYLATESRPNNIIVTKSHSLHCSLQGEFAVSTEYRKKEPSKDKDERTPPSEQSLHADFQLSPSPQIPGKINTQLTVGIEHKTKFGELKWSFNSLYQLKLQINQLVPFGQVSFCALLDYAREVWQYGLHFSCTLPASPDLNPPDI